MIAVVLVLASVILALYLRRRAIEDPGFEDKFGNGGASTLWEQALDEYGVPFAQFFIATIYTIYMKLTVVNALVFALKYMPSGICMYRFIRDIYITSKKRLRKKETELEDIQLQVKIMNTKLCVREAECAERTAALRRQAARLREARARVRDAIAAEDATSRWRDTPDVSDEGDITELLKELKYDRVALTETQSEMLDSVEKSQFESPENSIYSSISDVDIKTDCRVKIVKVTNVYKVAYLKHFIKQKRLRRASKQALLKKKMESIKKLLEDWQKSLSMVMSNKLSLLDARDDDTSEEAMGDHSKPCDPDSDPEPCADEYATWLPTSRSYYEVRRSEELWARKHREGDPGHLMEPESAARELYSTHSYGSKLSQCECAGGKGHVLFLLPRLPEETCSQVAIDEIKDEDDYDRDGFLTV